MLDPEQKKKALHELGDLSEAIYDEIVREFAAQAKPQLVELKAAIEAGDLKAASRLCHSIKGSSGNLRLKPIYEIALRMEQTAKTSSAADLFVDMAGLQELMAKLCAQFRV